MLYAPTTCPAGGRAKTRVALGDAANYFFIFSVRKGKTRATLARVRKLFFDTCGRRRGLPRRRSMAAAQRRSSGTERLCFLRRQRHCSSSAGCGRVRAASIPKFFPPAFFRV